MCGPQGMRSNRPSFDFIASPYLDLFDSMLGFHSPQRNRDKEHIHSVDWAIGMFRKGAKLRKKSWLANQYAFLYRKNDKLHGMKLLIDEQNLKKLSDPFATMILLADSSEQTCTPLGDLGDINVHDWALHE